MSRSRASKPWSEQRLHAWLARRQVPRVVSGSAMHDAAVLRKFAGRPVLCADQAIEGVHFTADAKPSSIGAKVVLRTLSDLAATAARPHAVTLTARLALDADESWVKRVIDGASRAAEKYGAGLVAGDLAGAPGASSFAVTALGEYAGTGRPPGRERARVGQAVLVTGPLGGSLAGRHLRIVPRLEAGRELVAAGATAMIDVSDGLALDVARLARASDVRVELERVPVHRDAVRFARETGRTPLDHALADGEDHELIATLPVRAAERLLERGLATCPQAKIVGRVASGRGVALRGEGELECFELDVGRSNAGRGRGIEAVPGYLHGERG